MSEVASDVLEELFGGVRDRVGSLIVVEWEEEGKRVGSGEWVGGVACGIVLSNISFRSNVENVRFASSATRFVNDVRGLDWQDTYYAENGAPLVVLVSFVLMVSLVIHRRGVD